MLKGKNVVIGVCGGIAAYKVVEVVSRLRKLSANVFVVMTEHGTKFVTPLTFQSISHNPVYTDMFAVPDEWDIEHISLANRADIVLIAPATANVIGKIANGIADDMLTTTLLATKAPVVLAPAMNYNMYDNDIVQENISKLKNSGFYILEPEVGKMAEGSEGKGRLPEPSKIVDALTEILNQKKNMKDLNVLITAGPTKEAIDPVRFISNNSSGKMGYSIAGAAAKRGANVVLVSGPVDLTAPFGLKVIDVISADEMYDEVLKNYAIADVIIMSAAVADYKSSEIKQSKMKKNDENILVELVKNKDIAAEIGKIKDHRIHVGFAAETDDLIRNAKSKLEEKNFDMIAANDLTLDGAGFGCDTNIIKLINKNGGIIDLPLMTKDRAADIILDEVLKLMATKDDNK
ncbi:MAG: bifunctional phosphopantothenoylcysteine decarboxylase/phosphopantothenate--cysteine ligase CoaBC [Clostridia bacterium]|jgi:phosphopantothenoylcysteine decarboxylase/phosphopantothenate--cysteine ligase